MSTKTVEGAQRRSTHENIGHVHRGNQSNSVSIGAILFLFVSTYVSTVSGYKRNTSGYNLSSLCAWLQTYRHLSTSGDLWRNQLLQWLEEGCRKLMLGIGGASLVSYSFRCSGSTESVSQLTVFPQQQGGNVLLNQFRGTPRGDSLCSFYRQRHWICWTCFIVVCSEGRPLSLIHI